MSTVMIAENEAATRKRLQKVLVRGNLNVESVADGPALLEKLETARPDLVLLDIGLPELDGIQVMEKLRDRG